MPKIKAREIEFHCQVQRSGTQWKILHKAKVSSQQNWKNGNRPGNKTRSGMVAAEIGLAISLASLILNLGSHTGVTTRTGPDGFKPYHHGRRGETRIS